MVDLDDLRKVRVVSKDLSLDLWLEAERPWNGLRHDLTQRRRILALSRSRELSLVGADDAIRAYAAYTLNRAGTNKHINAQAAQLLHQFAGMNLDSNDKASTKAALPKRPTPASVPLTEIVKFKKIRSFK